jgi:hypothetical protein
VEVTVCDLLDCFVKGYWPTARKGGMINERRIINDVTGSNSGLLHGTVPEFACRD